MIVSTPTPVRDGSRDGSVGAATGGTDGCPICARLLPSRRARYCSPACRQQAFRLRHVAAPDTQRLRATLRQQRQLVAHTVYECPACETRFLGERRCSDCNTFCRSLGLGGTCADCDAVILLADLLPLEVLR